MLVSFYCTFPSPAPPVTKTRKNIQAATFTALMPAYFKAQKGQNISPFCKESHFQYSYVQ